MAKSPKAKTNSEAAISGIILPPELAKKFSIGRKAINALVSLTHETQLFFKPIGEIVRQESAKSAEAGGKPMSVLAIVNLETDEEQTMIVPTVLESALLRTPGGYVGKSFAAKQGPKAPGKRYFEIELYELDGGK